MTLLLLSFIAGALTVLAPCVLPLLPVIIGSTVTVDNRPLKPYVVIVSLAVSIIFFTLILKWSTAFISIPQMAWTILSGGILIIFAITLLFPNLWAKITLASKAGVMTNRWLSVGYQKQNYIGDILIGGALGPVFSTCSPTYFVILTTVLPASFTKGIIYLAAYAFGLSIVLLAITIVGQKLVVHLDRASDPEGWFKKSLGVLFLIVGIAIIGGYDKQVEAFILNQGFFDVTKVESRLLQTVNNIPNPANITTTGSTTNTTSHKNTATVDHPNYIDINRPAGFVNSEPFTLKDFVGKKVILVDFMTYSCINCVRTFPYLNAWYDKYKDKGLVIVGIHTPEFAFEKDINNVRQALQVDGIKFPVVLDNDYGTWNAYGNQYWPRKYLIDINGNIVYDHIGEGGYAETEMKIQELLKEHMMKLGVWESIVPITEQPQSVDATTADKVGSPEMYFGSNRNEYIGNTKQGVTGIQTLTLPSANNLDLNVLYLGGQWNFIPEYAETTSAGTIILSYQAKNVYAVASSDIESSIEVYIDDKLVNTVKISTNSLYPLFRGLDYNNHKLKLVVPKGIRLFTLTFG